MQYAVWNHQTNSPSSIMQRLPDALQGASIDEIKAQGYLEMVTVRPEDYIPRFGPLSGPSHFELREDGRVYQTFPEADFSLAAVRKFLKTMSAKDAGRVLFDTDWYFIRQLETGQDMPDEVRQLRRKIRDHCDWIAADIDNTDARALVEYKWAYPTELDQEFINGTWIGLKGEPLPWTDPNNPSSHSAPAILPPPNPVAVPPQFNSAIQPLQVNASGNPVPPPTDAADVEPQIPNPLRMPYDPSAEQQEIGHVPIIVEDGAPHPNDIDPLAEFVPDPLDIRRMDEEARSKLDPELRARLEAEHQEWMRSRGRPVPVIAITEEENA